MKRLVVVELDHETVFHNSCVFDFFGRAKIKVDDSQ